MSTPITLTVGDIDLTYNTGHMGMDHGMLFQERDRRRRRHASINYEYYEKHSKDVSQSELCFCRTLGSTVSRLELLGHTLKSVEADYQVQIALDSERFAYTEDGGPPPNRLTFQQFIDFIRTNAVCDLKNDYVENYACQARRGIWSAR